MSQQKTLLWVANVAETCADPCMSSFCAQRLLTCSGGESDTGVVALLSFVLWSKGDIDEFMIPDNSILKTMQVNQNQSVLTYS